MQYLRQEIRKGMARIAAENPGVDFSVSTPEVNKALAELEAEGMRWYQFKAPLSDVQKAFKVYERAVVSASSPINMSIPATK